jgi:FAD/FMN-containing dehydrogenase
MLATVPMSAQEVRDAVRAGRAVDAARLNRILGIDATRGLLEVQAGTPWWSIAAELRPGDSRARVPTTMPTVGESVTCNAAGPDGNPAVWHVASLTLALPDGELRRVSRQRERELFALAIGGQGLFGTLYSVTLRIATLERAIEQAARPQERSCRGDAPSQRLKVLVAPEAVETYVSETEQRCLDWRIALQSVSVRRTLSEDETFLRWARRPYAEVTLGLSAPAGLGASVRSTQLCHELIAAAIATGGSFPIACTSGATREQTERCYPELKDFLAAKRRFDPNERLANDWYRRQRGLLEREPCEVRWAN